jgi:nitrogen regulatory protein PII 1
MVMIRAIVRPEKVADVLAALSSAGFPAVSKYEISGRGKQKGLRIGDIFYDEIPKELLMIVAKDEDKARIIDIIMSKARTSVEGAMGDGKIFVNRVEEAYTISSGKMEL